ncbi:MAG: four-helix bundle copper-binding protein [Planctomycetota bacterium]|nr:four-helix bundle copper-binding protein [Planctomycetota bacterium]
MPQQDPKRMEACAETCHECQDECLRTIVHCLEIGGEHASREHQTLLMDCALICGVSHSVLHRGSAQHEHTCRACAAICRACADDCERMGSGDTVMQECAQVCRRCAGSCEEMSGARA